MSIHAAILLPIIANIIAILLPIIANIIAIITCPTDTQVDSVCVATYGIHLNISIIYGKKNTDMYLCYTCEYPHE